MNIRKKYNGSSASISMFLIFLFIPLEVTYFYPHSILESIGIFAIIALTLVSLILLTEYVFPYIINFIVNLLKLVTK
jgi:hypothetical protein